jgi:hypothetical protein
MVAARAQDLLKTGGVALKKVHFDIQYVDVRLSHVSVI